MDEIRNAEAVVSKKIHPLERANIFSVAFFCWLIPFFAKGLKKELTEDDLYGPLKAHKAQRLGDELEIAWNYELLNKKYPSLWKAIVKVFGRDLIIYGFFDFILEFVIRLSQPLLLSKLLKYYERDQTDISKNEAYIYAGLIVLVSFLNVMLLQHYQLGVMHLGMKLRLAACSLIYRKALKLSKSALVETTVGQMVNLLSNDVGRFDVAMQHVNNLWVAPLEIVIVMGMVYFSVGVTGLVGAFFLLLFIPFQMYMGKKTSQLRLKTALRTDERVRLMNEIISGIQVIKMYTWEKPFSKLVEFTRGKEMSQIRATSVIRAIMMSCALVLNTVAVFLCILTYVLTGNIVSAYYAFTITSYYGILKLVVTMLFPQAITQFAETNVSVGRIRNFLLYDEINQNNNSSQHERQQKDIYHALVDDATGIHLTNASFKWINSLPDNTLRNITIDAGSNDLIAVVGTVGGGKTTLLHAILKELPAQGGTIDIQGTVSYASQEPWLFGGSVRQNIIFGQEFNQKKYDEVIRVCALQRDFTLFAHGDRTLVGDRGVTLSGGQRARINLARAVYKEADIYLLDDPLSAVDTHVGKQLFDDCISGYLRNKCVMLVTHQLQYLKNVDKIYLLEKGRIVASGSYSELQACENEFTKFLADFEEENNENPERKSKAIEDKENEDENIEAPTQEKEERGSGTISWSVYKAYLRAGGRWSKVVLLGCGFVISQVAASATDYFVSIWSNVEQRRTEQILTINETYATNDLNLTNNLHSNQQPPSQDFLSDILSQRNSIIIYSSLVIFTVVMTLSRSLAFFEHCMTASTNLHNNMFDKIVYATMRFFNMNPGGRILNRFSKDIGTVDEALPLTILDTIQIGLTVLAISIVIGSLNPWILLPTIIIVIIFYCLRLVFLATSRDVKRVESVTRSPIYTHLSASLHGLTTIRAFGAEEILKTEFDNYQDKHSAAYYIFLAANRTFGFWLDFNCIIYITLVLVSILFVESEIFGGNVGLALTQSVGLIGMFQFGMRQWSELENQMTSVERLEEYVNITPETDKNVRDPPKLWPEKGEVKFVNLCLRYSTDEPYVLKDLTFAVKPREKVGVVGRTGAGKSSLIIALFRLADIEGNVMIDNVDTKRTRLHVLRSKISIIPQEPVLFSGTLRKNLDPFDEYTDEILWNALEEVELKNAVSDLPAGLDSKMSEGGSNFSIGQRQLICLARAVIRNNKILVMDEATANVDPHTDELIQSTIRRKFAECTVFTIAHRLHTIMDSDKILVMDAGRVAEFDHPHTLLQNPNGVFTGLVMQTGKAMAENLTSIAKDSFKSNN